MGVNTKDIIQTDVKIPFFDARCHQASDFQRDTDPKGLFNAERIRYRNDPEVKNRAPEVFLRSSGMVQFSFRCEGEDSALSTFFCCYSDNPDIR